MAIDIYKICLRLRALKISMSVWYCNLVLPARAAAAAAAVIEHGHIQFVQRGIDASRSRPRVVIMRVIPQPLPSSPRRHRRPVTCRRRTNSISNPNYECTFYSCTPVSKHAWWDGGVAGLYVAPARANAAPAHTHTHTHTLARGSRSGSLPARLWISHRRSRTATIILTFTIAALLWN